MAKMERGTADQFGQTERQVEDAKEIVARHDRMKTKRVNWESHWQECYDYIVPRKAEVTKKTLEGTKRGNELFDTTAIMANQLLSGALHGMLTNPATKFFELMFGDAALDDDEAVRAWTEETADRMFVLLNNTNFQTEIHELYIDLGAIGTGCMYIGEHKDKIVHFGTRPMKEIFIEENNLGLIDTVYRSFKWKPRQIMQEFGRENLCDWVCEQVDKGCEDEWEIIHAVHPADVCEDDDSKSEKSKIFKFESYYVLKEKNLVLSEGGFKEFPYAVPRWTKTSGEIYGRGPGMDMLPDIKMVNEMMLATIQGAQKTINPPIMVPDDGVIGRVRLTPGGMTVVRAGSDPIKPLIVDARVDFGYQAVEDVRKRIRAGFYVDQLQLSQGPQMTATEVMQRTEEKLRLMGPVLGRQHFEFLRPVIERVFGIMVRRGMIPPAPPAIQGKKFDVRYSSLVARAQRMSEGQNLTRAISVAAPVFQIDQKAVDVVNADEAIKYIFDVYGVPSKLLHDRRTVEEQRKARAEAQAQAAKQMQEQHMADVAGKTMPGMSQMLQATKDGGGA